jgi:hypothetical protein
MSVASHLTIPSSDDWRWRSFYDETDWRSLGQTVAPILYRLAASLESLSS